MRLNPFAWSFRAQFALGAVLCAALELGCRLRREEREPETSWRDRLRDRALRVEEEEREWVGALFLDPKERCLDEQVVSYGGLDGAFVDRLIDEHLSMKQNHNHVLWGLMNIAIWHRRFFKNG